LVDEAARRELTIREALSLFCEREIGRKDEQRIEMGIGLARFPFVRDLDGFDFGASTSRTTGECGLKRLGGGSGEHVGFAV
jgi:hypothetical protein